MRTAFRSQVQKSWFDRLLQRFAQTRIGGKLFITIFPAIDKRLMPLSRGRIRLGIGAPECLLRVRGAKSGQLRVTPLLYTPRGDGAIVLVASKAGAEKHPAWYHNVVANPAVEVEVDGERHAMTAREVDGAERDELWALVNDNYSGYETYQKRTPHRKIPVILLEPREGASVS